MFGVALSLAELALVVRQGDISLVQAVPRRLKSGEALSDAYRFPAEQRRRADVVIKPVANHHCLRRLTAGLRKSKLKNCRVRFFETHFRGREADRDERH